MKAKEYFRTKNEVIIRTTLDLLNRVVVSYLPSDRQEEFKRAKEGLFNVWSEIAEERNGTND